MINPYLKKLSAEDFRNMNIAPGKMVVEALLADKFSQVITISDSSDYGKALVHRVISHGAREPGHIVETSSKPQVGQMCFICGNCLDRIESDGPFFFVDEEDCYAWWGDA